MIRFNVITACSRFDNLRILAERIAAIAKFELQTTNQLFSVRWLVAFQDLTSDPHGCVKFNEMIGRVPSYEWIYVLDDDNLVDLRLFQAVTDVILRMPDLGAVVVNQVRYDSLRHLTASPDNVRVGAIDTAQVCFKKSFIGENRFPENSPVADGEFYEKLFRSDSSRFFFLQQDLSTFNALSVKGEL